MEGISIQLDSKVTLSAPKARMGDPLIMIPAGHRARRNGKETQRHFVLREK